MRATFIIGSSPGPMLQRNRKKANFLSKGFLENGSPISDDMILAVLCRWRFHQNKDQINVTPKGQDWVHSDTFGAVQTRHGEVLLTKTTDEQQGADRRAVIEIMRAMAITDIPKETQSSWLMGY